MELEIRHTSLITVVDSCNRCGQSNLLATDAPHKGRGIHRLGGLPMRMVPRV